MRVRRIHEKLVTDLGDKWRLCLVFSFLSMPHLSMAAVKVLHWEFEGSLGDSSASENLGEFYGAGEPIYVEGRFGKAIRLNSHEFVVCHTARNVPTAKGESWTINLWARLTTPPRDGAIFGGFGGRAEIAYDKRFLICFNESVYL